MMLIFIVILSVGCSRTREKAGESPEIAQRPIISYAKRLRIEVMDGYSQVLILNPWQGARNFIQKISLVPEGKKIPGLNDSSEIVNVPVNNMICTSTTHLAMISVLNETNSLTGFSGTRYIFDTLFSSSLRNGQISEIGYEENLNIELILKLKPDLVMVYGIEGESSVYINKLKGLGINVIYNADYLEESPLGKAEWIKLMGALFGKTEMADSIFREIEKQYLALKSYVKSKADVRPGVLLGLPFRDTWYVSPGNSYISEMISDAGGKYLWEDSKSPVSMPVGIENVFIRASEADFWLNTGDADSKSEILAVDPRLGLLPCFRNGNVFNNKKRINKYGGNDYWEGGTINPHIILRDIASILHPSLFYGYEQYYYQKLN